MSTTNYADIRTGHFLFVSMAALIRSAEKILYLFVSRSKSDPMIVGKKYLEYLTEHRVMPRFLRLDRAPSYA